MSGLVKRKCTACVAGIAPLKGEALQRLQQELGGDWKIVQEHHLEKEYRFKNFAEALQFVNDVGRMAELEGHHPDILLKWGRVTLTLWTHKIDGLTESDFILAAKCDVAFLTRANP